MSLNDDKTMLDPSGGPSKDGAKMKLGPYETTELLGRGGMAVVYKGMQQSLGRVVAIKILPKEFSRDRQFVGRFHREAESVAKLNHPNIIQIIDKGEDKGTCYFVMEYVKGQSLSAKLADKGVTMKELVEVAVQVCSALHYAHEQGVVHRDIKPANILLDETTGVAKVADFGIAQLAEKSTAIGTLTGDHMAMGTLDYMAPEQKRDAKNVDRRADVFSVGVMLYEMATGRVPMGLFDPPSRINKDIPKEFDSIVMKCLRDKPTERYQTCQELSSALLALPQNPSTMIRMITSVKSGVTNIGTQIGRRNPAYLAAVLFFVVALGAGSWAAWKYGLKRGGGVASNGGTSGGNGGASSGGNNGGNNAGTQTPKPPDDTAAAEAEKAFRKSMKEAEALLADEKFANALALYDRLLEGATATQRQELLLAKDDAKRQQARWLAEDYGDRLRAAKVDPARADAEAVRRLEELLRSAREADVPQDVLNEISAEVVTARSAAAANAAEAEKKAAEEARRKRFQNALAAARKAIEDDRMEDAERALAEASEAQPTGEEIGEYAAARKAFEDKRSAAATADENAKRLGRLLQEVSDSAKAGKITAARLTLADASALAQALGGEFPEKVKVATAEVDRIEADLKVRGKLQEARDQESANPELAARLYRDAAALMAAGSPERKSALEKADILDRQVSDAKAKAEYDRHMEAARAAAKEGNWKTAETEALLALQVR
ncbi:MAG: protein kinase, partial [Planctomycetia bacterium]|nr:protein kinase [Planctomycetia bacterium]